MNIGEKINAIHAIQNVLNPRMAGSERVVILDELQTKVVTDKLIEIITSLSIYTESVTYTHNLNALKPLPGSSKTEA